MPNKLTIEKLLVGHHYLTQDQLDRIVHSRGQNMDQSVEELLMDLGYVTEEAVIQCAALRDHIPVVNLDDTRIGLKTADVVSPAFAERSRIIPIDSDGDRLVVAAAYPMDQDIPDETTTITGMEVGVMLITPYAMEKAIEETYESSRERLDGPGEAMDVSSLGRQSKLLFMERVEGAPVVCVVNAIIENAYSKNASDIHVEPGKHDPVIHMGISGDLIIHTTLEMRYHRPIVTRLKLTTDMDIAEKRLPQDGEYHCEKASVPTDLGISVLPAIFGEKMVFRLLGNDRDNSLMDIEHLGMNEEQKEVFKRILEVSCRIVLVTDPTGSGKTTTLYAVLSRIVKKKINVAAVEDLVEKVAEGITQVQINPRSGLTFTTALRSISGRDPDVIMMGEMRDEEAVSIGVRVAIAGHLMLSTLHTSDCISTINRLHNMGVPPYMTAAVLSGIVSQRLVKLLYPECRRPYAPDKREKRLFGEMRSKEPESLFRAVGCPCCSGTGYIRRKAVYGLMKVGRRVGSMVLDDTLPRDIHLYQRKKGLKSIKECVLQMVLEGETSMEKAKKIIYPVE